VLASSKDGLKVEVTDTGPGIPEDTRVRLFEPFFTKHKAKGTGLGLSIAKRFVEDHNGTIRVETTPEKGTSFFIELPRVDMTAAGEDG